MVLKQTFIFRIRTYVSGTDQQSGRLISVLRNGQHTPQCVVYTHVVPWFIKIYYHTIRFTCHPLDIDQVINRQILKLNVFLENY